MYLIIDTLWRSEKMNFEEYEKEISNISEEKLKSFLESCFEFDKKLLAIRICGWTPSWNDGEPCYHNQDCHILFEDDYVCEVDYFNDEFSEIINKIFEEKGELLSGWTSKFYGGINLKEIDKESENRKRVIESIISEYYSRAIYDTNYLIVAIRKNDKVEITIDDDYECGY